MSSNWSVVVSEATTAGPGPSSETAAPTGTGSVVVPVLVDAEDAGRGGRPLRAGRGAVGALLQHQWPGRGVGHAVGDRAAERPRLGQRGGDVGGVARIEPLAGRLRHPDVAPGHGVDVLHAAAQAVGLVDEERTLGGGAVGVAGVEVVVAALVVDGAVAPDRRTERGEEQVGCGGRRRLNPVDAHRVALRDGDQHVAAGRRQGDEVVVGGVGRVDRGQVPLSVLVPAGPVEGEHVGVGGHVEVVGVGGQRGHTGRDVLGDFGRTVAVDDPGDRGRRARRDSAGRRTPRRRGSPPPSRHRR